MFDALSVAKYIDSIPLIQPAVESCAGAFVDQLRVRFGARFEQKDVSARVLGAQVNMAKYTRSNAGFGTIEDQIGIDVDNGGFLFLLDIYHMQEWR